MIPKELYDLFEKVQKEKHGYLDHLRIDGHADTGSGIIKIEVTGVIPYYEKDYSTDQENFDAFSRRLENYRKWAEKISAGKEPIVTVEQETHSHILVKNHYRKMWSADMRISIIFAVK